MSSSSKQVAISLGRTSQNAVWAKFVRPPPVSWGAAEVTQRRAPGRTRAQKTGRRPPRVPPTRLSGALSQERWAPSMQLSGHSDPRGAEGAHEKGRRPRRGRYGPPGPVTHPYPTVYKPNTADELLRINLPRTSVNKGWKGRAEATRSDPDVRVGDALAVQIPRICFFLASKSSLVMMP
jgi:hypothetical protein